MAKQIKFIGISEFNAHTKHVAKQVKQKTSLLVQKTGKDIEGEAKKNLTRNKSVRSGELRRSIRSEFNGNENNPIATIGTRIEYAEYVEYGTRKMQAKPYFTPAVQMHEKIFLQKMDELYKGAMFK